MAKRGTLCPYTCTGCGKACEGAPMALLSLLGLCSECQDKRFDDGLAKQRAAEEARG
jgi:hypothetical protein